MRADRSLQTLIRPLDANDDLGDRQHVLEVDDLSAGELAEVLALAERDPATLPRVLEGAGVALVFEKPSNRTRNSSEIAAAAVRDTDARIGHILDAVERAGALERTAFVLVADHGMQLADTAVTGDWDRALGEAGVAARDEGYGFLYLTGG